MKEIRALDNISFERLVSVDGRIGAVLALDLMWDAIRFAD
jgi:hypothetical protein